MHPGMMFWWKQRHGCGQEARAGWGDEGGYGGAAEGGYGASGDAESGSGPFGVRRPLRFMAHRLRLSEEQVAELAKILADLKTERSQAAVDHRRSSGAIADALEADSFDDARIGAAADARVKSAQQLRDAVVKALKAIHALLDPAQRKELAYLLRTGQLLI